MRSKCVCLHIAHVMPRIAGIDFISDHPCMNRSHGAGITVCQEGHERLELLCRNLFINVKCITVLSGRTPRRNHQIGCRRNIRIFDDHDHIAACPRKSGADDVVLTHNGRIKTIRLSIIRIRNPARREEAADIQLIGGKPYAQIRKLVAVTPVGSQPFFAPCRIRS